MSWKSNLCWAIIGALIGSFLINPLAVYFFQIFEEKPNVDINFANFYSFDMVSNVLNEKLNDDYTVQYAIGPGTSQLFLIDNKTLLKEDYLFLYENFCNCTTYTTLVQNKGKNFATVTFDLQSSEIIEVVNKTRRITVSCGGILTNKGCSFVINELPQYQRDEVAFRSKASSSLAINCKLNNDEKCKIDYLNVYTATIDPSANIILNLNGKNINFPQFDGSEKIKFYELNINTYI